MRINKKGFTLAELLIVLSIAGIMAVFAVPSYLKGMTKAKVRDTRGQLVSVFGAGQIYYTKLNSWPKTDKNTAADINKTFGVNLLERGGEINYQYRITGNLLEGGNEFTPIVFAEVKDTGQTPIYIFLRLDKPLGALTNPCCSTSIGEKQDCPIEYSFPNCVENFK